MSNFRRRLMMSIKKSKLPGDYTELEYIESTGTQYIDTGYYPNPTTTKVEVTFMLTDNTVSPQGLFGSRYAKELSKSSCNIFFNTVKNRLRLDWLGSLEYETTNLNEEITLICINNEVSVIVNDVSTKYTSTQTKLNAKIPYSMYIGNFNNVGNPYTNGGYAKWKTFKIYDENNNLVMWMIPVLDKNNVACMYDKVNKEFYYNQGTGTFIDGPKKEYVKNGLILWYDGINNTKHGHDNTSTIWEDLSGNNYDTGNISLGTETYWDENNMVFNNTNKMILISNSDKNTEILNTINSNQFTIQFFVNEYTKSNDNYSTILWSSNDSFAFYSYTSQSIFYLKNGSNSRPTIPISSVIGKTVTISFDLNNKTLKLYSDTDKSSEVNISQTIKANNFNIGRNSIHNNFSIGEIRIYNRILTDEEIQYNCEIDKIRFGIDSKEV